MDPARRALLRLTAASGDGGRLESLCERFGVRLLVAFGSSVRPDALPARDLDVAVAFCRRKGAAPDLVGVVNALIDLVDFEGVDVLDLDRAGVVARDQALTATLPLYEEVRGDFAREQMRASLERMDTAWLRRLDLALMAT